MKDERNLRVQLKYWRKRRNKTIRDLAAEAHVSSITISRVETGKLAMPRPVVLERLATALGISVDELVVDATEGEAA